MLLVNIIFSIGVPLPNTNIDRAEIRTALQNWQMGLMMGDQDNKEKRNQQQQQQQQYTGLLRTGRSLGDGKAAQTDATPSGGIYQKKPNVRRREPRRHTLQNGIDYNMLKRMKQIEQEKDVLVQGLNAIEKAREWYLKQISIVQEKMKYLGRMGHVVSISFSNENFLCKNNICISVCVCKKIRINQFLFKANLLTQNINFYTEVIAVMKLSRTLF